MGAISPGAATDRLGYYFQKEKWRLAVITATGLFYNLGLAAVPWFEGQMVQYLCDILGGRRAAAEMVRMAACYLLAVLAIQGARYGKRLYVRRFANQTGRRMKLAIYENLLWQRGGEAAEAGDMMTRVLSDADACAEGMRKCTTEVFDTGVVMAAYLGLLLSYDVRLTLLVMLFPPAACLLAERLKTVVTRNVARSRESSARLSGAVLERVTNALTYRIHGREAGRDAELETLLDRHERLAVRANIWENSMQPIYQVISMVGAGMILWQGGRNVLGGGWAVWDVAAFTAYFSCYRKLAVKASKAAKLFNAVQKAKVSWKRIQPWLHPVAAEECLPLLPAGVLSAEGLTFAYDGRDPVFSDAALTARPGEIVGITGPVACGKTTLGRIFTGEAVQQGRVRLGTAELTGDPAACARAVGYLGHQPELFSGTIEENICMGQPGDVWPVLRAVCLDGEVAGLPQGIHTTVGSGGVRLSGGQQARLALARTLYHRRPVLVLDDPFSAVDPDTEARIFENLRRDLGDGILLLISHRLALFPQTDRVVWMDGGRVTEGTHQALAEGQPAYRQLWQAQQKGGVCHETR